MAQDQSELALPQKPLDQFIKDCLHDLNDPAIRLDPATAFVVAKNYSTLKEIFLDNEDELKRAFSVGDEEFRKVLSVILSRAQSRIEKETPQLQKETANTQVLESEFVQVAASLRAAENQIKTKTEPDRVALQQQRRAFAEKLARHFSGLDEPVLKRLRDSINRATEEASRAKSPTEQNSDIGERVLRVLKEDPDTGPLLVREPTRLKQIADDVRPEQQELARVIWKNHRVQDAVVGAILREDMVRPDVFVNENTRRLSGLTTKQPESDALIERISRDSLVATKSFEVYTSKLPIDPATNKPISIGTPLVFFQVNETGIKKGLGQLADIALSLPFIPQSFRESVVQGAIARSWEKIIGNPALLTERFGSVFVSSPAYQQAIAQGNAMFGQEKRGGLGSVFSGFLYEGMGLVRGPNEVGLLFLEQHRMASQQTTLVTVVGQFSWQHAFMASSYAHGGAYHLDFLGGLGQWALSHGARKGIGAGAKKVAGIAIGKGLGATIGGFLGTLLGPGLGSAIGAFVGSVVIDKGLGLLGKIGGGLFNFLSGEFLAGLINGKTKYKDPVALPLAICLGVMAILFGLGGAGFLNLLSPTNLSNASLTSSFALGAGGGDNEGGLPPCDPTVDPECAVASCKPGEDCSWPTACGCVTQGPRNGPGQTHRTLNAIDVGVSSCGKNHIDVRATHNGTVTKVISTYRENQHDNTYGNHVILEGTDERGKKYQTLYSHLWVVAAYRDTGRIIQQGDSLTKGEPIGKTDNNGKSFGEHLHYEYRGGGNISTILPVSIPSCNYGTCPRVCW